MTSSHGSHTPGAPGVVLVTNSVFPYCFDVATLLALPAGLRYRFRYLSKWIRLSAPVKSIEGLQAIIVLRRFVTAELVPVRWAVIDRVQSFGDIHYVEFVVGGYYSQPGRSGLVAAMTEAFDGLGVTNEPGKHLSALVFEIKCLSPASGRGSDDPAEWYEIVRAIGSEACYADFGFLRVARVETLTGRSAEVQVMKEGGRALSLRSGATYLLDVTQHTPWQVDETEAIRNPYDVVLRAEPGTVTVVRGRQRVVGKYDLLRFILKTPEGYRRRLSFLELVVKPGESSWKAIPSVLLSVTIAPTAWSRFFTWFRAGIGAAGFAGYIFAESLATRFGLGAEWVRGLGILVLVLATRSWAEVGRETAKKAPDLSLP